MLAQRPTNFKLGLRFINNATNIPEDDDDTSLENLASYYQNQIFGSKKMKFRIINLKNI